ncbi:hypothetical protein DPEC_G00231640 [Dallia pectoralis]|uniref:Uncharacterized protein n=1 Tax=Dallia pectoralis TaxID=75939 RepID=A0ACC2FX87_DALPE|nr:hypothetical protein DPEC_G00231640 [Dallia pectoralis]
MSAGDVVCTGWLIKSPPEKKLKRYAWRRRWFVLRRGRMSGNPDVLEYYRKKTSKKPIRTIDLKECEVQMQTEQRLVKREFENQPLFVIKTMSRIFYLVAKTEEEMNGWVSQIREICHLGLLDVGSALCLIESEEGRTRTQSPLDYLILSQCATGTFSISRCDSFTNSDRSLEQCSSDATAEDVFSLAIGTDSFFSPFPITGSSPRPIPLTAGHDPPFSAPCGPTSSSSPLTLYHTPNVFKFDKPYPSTILEATSDGLTPPPLPPKPVHLSDCLSNEGFYGPFGKRITGQPAPIPRRISMSGLPEPSRKGDVEGGALRSRNKRLSLNLPFSIASPNYQEDSYVPMASPSSCVDADLLDGYIPMSPSSTNFLKANDITDGPPATVPLTNAGLHEDREPPPVNRNLKPRRKARPPPLDLSDLSTIRECRPLIRTMTEPRNLLERRPGSMGIKREQEASIGSAESRHLLFPTNDSSNQPWHRRSNLDYLSLDFNSASPSPVQKKPFLADEHRVDYVQVDEKKTQALQSTKMEWKDVRQSKV